MEQTTIIITEKIKAILVNLAANDKLPSDLTMLDSSVFKVVIEPLVTMNEEDRFTDAVETAQISFWNKVREFYPEIKTGDLSVDTKIELDNVLSKAVIEWVETNK